MSDPNAKPADDDAQKKNDEVETQKAPDDETEKNEQPAQG